MLQVLEVSGGDSGHGGVGGRGCGWVGRGS